MTDWTAADLTDLTGTTVVVTGANSGLGLETTRELARHGAHVIMACRNLDKAERARADLTGSTEIRALDLADLASVAEFADGLGEIDVLVNNAGIMAVPLRRTVNGFESQFGTNHLGHFALTGRLLPQVRDRVVTLSSMAHRLGRISLDDPNWDRRRYRRWLAYGQSKLANLMFAYELARRLAAHGSQVRSIAAHPGYADTELQGKTETFQDRFMVVFDRAVAQSAAMGALPTLYAATQDVASGSFVGPTGLGGMRGYPGPCDSAKASHDERVAAALWARSEELTGVSYLG